MFYSGEARALPAEQTHVVQEIETDLQKLLRQLLDLRYAHPNRVTMAIYSENKDALFELAQAYNNTAIGLQMRVQAFYYSADPAAVKAVVEIRRARGIKDDDDDEPKIFDMFGRKVVRQEIKKTAEFLSHKPDASTGIVFSLEGKSAYAMWTGEHGLHTFVEGKTSNQVFIHTSDVTQSDYRPPSFLERRGAIQPANVGAGRRTYNRAENFSEDHLLATRRQLAWQLAGRACLLHGPATATSSGKTDRRMN